MVFEDIMDAEFYLTEILSNYELLLFVKEKLSDGYWFQQDNNTEHTSHLAVRFMEENTVIIGEKHNRNCQTSIWLQIFSTI